MPTFIQAGDTDQADFSGQLSGATANVFLNNVTLGHCVAVFIWNASNTLDNIISVTSAIGVFTRIEAGVGVGPAQDGEWWVCLNATGVAKSVTVTTGGGVKWSAQGTEWSGVTRASSGGFNTDIATNVSLAVTPFSSPSVVLVGELSSDLVSGPSAAWTDYNSGDFWSYSGNGADVAWQAANNAHPLAIAWAQSGPGTQWVTVGLILGSYGTIFIPPVVLDNPPFDADTYDEHKLAWMLAKWRLPMARGVNVYALSDGTFVQDVATAENSNTAIPAYPLMPDQGSVPNLISRSINASGTPTEIDATITPYIVHIYYGGHANPISATEAAALTAYTAYGIGYGGDIH